jgi:hypothetical protein
VYFILGAGKRERLPSCIECAVRMAYPNPWGTKYKEFRDY